MKKHLLFILAALLPLVASAQTKAEIDGIWYNLVSKAKQAEVTFKGDSYNSYWDEYSGSITIPATVTYEGVSYSVISIGEGAFRNCSSLTAITLPENSQLTSIGGYAFQYCSSLTAINIPEGVTSIGERAFYDCSSLTAITLPEGVTSIGNLAFYDCTGELTVNCNIPSASSGVFYSSNFTKVTIGSEVTSIGDYAFSDCSLTSITIPENSQLKIIGEGAFVWCSSLTAITIPEGVTSIGKSAFSSCRSLTAITLPESVTSIGEGAFNACSSLTSITLPESVTSIGDYAFNDCSSLTAINIPESSQLTSIGGWAFYWCSSLTAITIPESVTSIGSSAFWGCRSLTAITIPEGVTSIEEDAFGYCYSLTTITIPESVTSIGYCAFYDCSSLTAITIPESVTSIGSSAFFGCRSLTAINIPEGVTSIGSSAFWGCSSLTAITVAEGNAKYDSRGGCNAIIETNSNTLIRGCSTTIIPESVTSIGRSAFEDCRSLTAINIPEGVTSIEDYAFSYCTSLTDVYCYAEEVPTTQTNAFYNSNIENATLHVPANALNAYKTTASWSSFGKFETLETNIPVANIILSQSSATLTEGGTLTLTATVTPDDATDNSITWSSSNTSVATVDANGKVTAKAAGTATITATANDGSGVKASCVVTVEKKVVAVSSITLSQSSATLTEGETLSLTATVKPTNATNKGITWSSSNTSVATVDTNGKVTAIAPGTATITATANDGSGAKASCEVTVVAAEYTITYYVDGEVYHQETLTRGTAIVPIEAPEKEGYTFSGWSEVPATMPAEDITITGTFTVNTYTVTFTIDGVVIASSTQEYGSAITVPSAPTREGYTFSGWGEVPTTMPASDVTYDATYIPNTYKVYYFVGHKLVHVAEVAYGEVIPEYIYEPTTEGDVFMGWIGDTYDTMPAHDVTYTANIANGIENSEINTLNSEFIYDLSGRKVTDTENLTGGVYIIGGKKVIIK